MKKCKRMISILLAVVMLAVSIPAAYAADPNGALNGQSGKWADFNEDIYDTVTFISTVKNANVNGFEWPSGGTVLLKTSGSRWSLTDDDTPNCKGIKIPAGLVVDIYKYYQSAGMTEPVYKLLGHFDTTDGTAYTIGAGSDSKGLNGNICYGSQFDESVYDSVIGVIDLLNGKASWPASGTVLLKEHGIGWTTSILENVTIPAGLIVDFYSYSKPHGSEKDEYTYRLVAHFDTTDGNPYTVDPGSHTTGSMYDQWGEVSHVYTPGTPSDSYSNSYTDVTSNSWYYHPVMTLTEGGLLNGYGGGLFGPDDALTKGQVSILVTRLVGNKVVGDGSSYASYSDSTPATRAFAAIWYAGRLSSSGGSALLTYYETSLATGAGGLMYSISSDGSLGSMWRAVYDNWRASLAAGKNINYISSIDELPDASAIRRWIDENWEQMANILHTNAPTVGGRPDNRTVKEKTVDACEEAICRAYNLGMISGVDGNGTFDPYGILTRGQLAQMLYNMGWVKEGILSYS
ncbi:MAG TPA: S-layer homology domain-containing protein [Candidatus Agathobaculum pullicola]|nr:S-layer homology domain-containing protein [Candidatus Agathobaculum pullicola]